MPTGSMILSVDNPVFMPSKPRASEKDSAKKLKYLKNPRKPRFNNMLVHNQNFRCLSFTELLISAPEKILK